VAGRCLGSSGSSNSTQGERVFRRRPANYRRGSPTARGTVFSAGMMCCNGVMGLNSAAHDMNPGPTPTIVSVKQRSRRLNAGISPVAEMTSAARSLARWRNENSHTAGIAGNGISRGQRLTGHGICVAARPSSRLRVGNARSAADLFSYRAWAPFFMKSWASK